MRTSILGFAVLLLVFGASASPVAAQEQTERYIPIGYSPGVSGKYAYLGQITALDPANRTVTVQHETQHRTVRIVDQTRIWLDRSSRRQTIIPGTFDDLEVGQTVEIKFTDYERKDTANWVKVAQR